jgi:hypothetical protein
MPSPSSPAPQQSLAFVSNRKFRKLFQRRTKTRLTTTDIILSSNSAINKNDDEPKQDMETSPTLSVLERTQILISQEEAAAATTPTPLPLDDHDTDGGSTLIKKQPMCSAVTHTHTVDTTPQLVLCGMMQLFSDDVNHEETPIDNTTATGTLRYNKPPRNEPLDQHFSIECIFADPISENERHPPSLEINTSSSSSATPPLEDMEQASEIGDEDQAQKTIVDQSPYLLNNNFLPELVPTHWPQRPLLLRPTPNSGTTIHGVRFDSSSDYIWEPQMNKTWTQALDQLWGRPTSQPNTLSHGSNQCASLPINNGNELPGQSLVIDFETSLFQGSLMLRLRNASGSTREAASSNKHGYFGQPETNHLRYQAVIRGKFKRDLAFTSLVTGHQLENKCGKLPLKWILWSGLKVVGFFAPQLSMKLDVPKPYCLMPLGSTPRVIIVDKQDKTHKDSLLETPLQEPTIANKSLVNKAFAISNPLERARARKKAFDKLYCSKSTSLKTDLGTTYTFEFLQHLFDYGNFSIDLGAVGNVRAKDVLNGQPLQLMAKVQTTTTTTPLSSNNVLWSFDLWNECLWEDAQKHHNAGK